MALRLLYGFLTYFDSLDAPQSPVGTYQQFLQSLDKRVRGELTPEDAFAFLDVMTDQTPDTARAVFVHMDEFNAARGPFPVSNFPLSALVTKQTMLDRAVAIFAGCVAGQCKSVVP